MAGYEIPEHLRFHQGHAWALGESPNLVRAGIDDFAAKLIGAAEEVNLPQRGQWIRQGQKVWSFRVNGELVEMVSPIEGTVSDVNDEVVRHPEIADRRSLRQQLADDRAEPGRQDQLPQPARAATWPAA